MRDLVRFRRALVEARTNCRNRILQVLESANFKLANVASDVFGVSGMAMLRALAQGGKTPREIAELAKGALRKKLVRLELALHGSLSDDHRFMLAELLKALAQDQARIVAAEARIAAAGTPAGSADRQCGNRDRKQATFLRNYSAARRCAA